MGLLRVFSIFGKQQFSCKPFDYVNYIKKAISKDFVESSEICHILKLMSSARHLKVCADKHFIQKKSDTGIFYIF